MITCRDVDWVSDGGGCGVELGGPYISATPLTNRRTSGIKLTTRAPRHRQPPDSATTDRCQYHNIRSGPLQGTFNSTTAQKSTTCDYTHHISNLHTQPQPCSVSPQCSPGNSPPKSSTSHSSSPPHSCCGKGSQSSQTRHHPSSSYSQDPWSPRSKEETCYFCGIEDWIHKWERLWCTTSRARIFRLCIV
jgi:hypothetical protein